jgi:hypothetical protein
MLLLRGLLITSHLDKGISRNEAVMRVPGKRNPSTSSTAIRSSGIEIFSK